MKITAGKQVSTSPWHESVTRVHSDEAAGVIPSGRLRALWYVKVDVSCPLIFLFSPKEGGRQRNITVEV